MQKNALVLVVSSWLTQFKFESHVHYMFEISTAKKPRRLKNSQFIENSCKVRHQHNSRYPALLTLANHDMRLQAHGIHTCATRIGTHRRRRIILIIIPAKSHTCGKVTFQAVAVAKLSVVVSRNSYSSQVLIQPSISLRWFR